MGKGKKKKPISPKKSIQSLQESRDGGQIALRGYTYQFLYACYLMLTNQNESTIFQLEGIEDVDRIEKQDGGQITHIQLKYSVNRQNASFLADVLQNFLEAYLLDKDRYFKMVYDFPVANGNLKKILEGKLDEASLKYWKEVIEKIKESQTSWDWSQYNFEDFLSRLSFENLKKEIFEDEIEKALIQYHDISTDNLKLYVNSIKILCLKKMENRDLITRKELVSCVEAVKMDISKGAQNPAHSWIRKLSFSKNAAEHENDFYEGKKATPADIAKNLPVERPMLEGKIITSIQENIVTVIKASSGQGKTTLALRSAYLLQNEYTVYQVTVCDNNEQLGNTVQYFNSRLRLGEKLLILIDNLDGRVQKWNGLVQLLQAELPTNYKVLLTTREIDWYNYSGDLSNIRSINIIVPTLEEQEAKNIFQKLKETGNLHPSITNWKREWNRIAERKLLIEYVYLLTHGEMLSERITAQMKELGQSSFGQLKCDILRKVCFADVCGVKLTVRNLFCSQKDYAGADFGELLKNLESEFLIHLNTDDNYVEGLHPIRSWHIVNQLHEFVPLENTAISVIKMVEKKDYAVLFSHIPEFSLNKSAFFKEVLDFLWDENDLSGCLRAVKGLFSGDVLQYYRDNKDFFDDANAHFGLELIAMEKCPFKTFDKFGVSVQTLDNLQKIHPDSLNGKYLQRLRDKIPDCDLPQMFIFGFCSTLYQRAKTVSFEQVTDLESYSQIAEWIYDITSELGLVAEIPLNEVWKKSDRMSLECMARLMYLSFCSNQTAYRAYISQNMDEILTYYKHMTKSHSVYVDETSDAIHIEYILSLSEIGNANEESVSRIKQLCRMLPIFKKYCTDALKPEIEMLKNYFVPDDAHKEMPIENVVIMFHQHLTSLWNKTILSNYEFEMVTDWIEYWFNLRSHICTMANDYCECLTKAESPKLKESAIRKSICIYSEYQKLINNERKYPGEENPFEEDVPCVRKFQGIKRKYFWSITNFTGQFPGLLKRDPKNAKLAMFNILAAQRALSDVQQFFDEIVFGTPLKTKHLQLCELEKVNVSRLMMGCYYYYDNPMNKGFNKYTIDGWYKARCTKERQKIQEGLSDLTEFYSVIFPENNYYAGILNYYPIIIGGFDKSSEDAWNALLISGMQILNSKFDYLEVLFKTNQGEIENVAYRIPKQFFAYVKNALESPSAEVQENRTSIYPVEVTPQMLGCFSQKYIVEKAEDNLAKSIISKIGEYLWDYSMCRKLLAGPEDSDYGIEQLDFYRMAINEKMALLDLDESKCIEPVCLKVFSGSDFSSEEYNSLLNTLIFNNV